MRKEITVFSGRVMDLVEDWPSSENALEFIKWFQDKLEEVPEEYHSRTRIQIEGHDWYDGGNDVSIEISYEREETIEERKARRDKEQEKKKAIEESEKAKFLELKKKYGP